MANGSGNGNGVSLTRGQVDALVTWGARMVLASLMALLLWNAQRALDTLEVQSAEIRALRDAVNDLRTRREYMQGQIDENTDDIEDIRTLLQAGQVRVLPEGSG